MEPWKIILLVAAIPAGIAAGLSFMNGSNLREKVEERERQQQSVVAIQERLDRTVAEIQDKEREAGELTQDTESSKTQLAQAESRLFEVNAEIEAMQVQVTTADQQVADAREIEAIMQEFSSLNETIATLDGQIAMEDQQINTKQNLLSVRNARMGDLQRQIDRMQAQEKNRKLGVMDELETTVTNAYNNWGFVIINAGDAEGVVKNAQMDVFRHGKPVCKVMIKEVMPHEAIAEVISSTLLPGQLVQVGDTVVKKGAL